ncbi:MAG: sugar phosphate nucleotidyltransferase [Thermoproteota archaeon]
MKNVVGGILCGGYGKRLKPITDTIPKPLIEIKENYTILDRQLLQMKHANINEVFLLAGYLHEKIKERYNDQWNGIAIRYLIEDKPRGTLFAINNLLKSSEAEVYVVMNGDIVTDINLAEMLRRWKPGSMSMAITKLISPYGIVKVSNEKVVGFEEKPELPYYINAGIYIIDRKIKDYFFSYEEGDVEKLVFPKLANEGFLEYYLEEGTFWQSIDSQKDLESVRKEFLNRVDTPWGYEKNLVATEKYVIKELYIMKGFGVPLHMHEQKDETLHIISGEGEVYLNGKKLRVQSGDIIRIEPRTKHRIEAIERLKVFEYSTPNPEDYIELSSN